jgi:hypothetical protein
VTSTLRATGVLAAVLFLHATDIGVAAGVGSVTQDRAVEAAVSTALERYSTALESLDAESVKKVQPAIDVESLKKAFREMRALDVTIADLKVLSSDAAVVRVSCKVTQTLTPRAGSKQTTAVNRVVRLKKHEDGFVIDAFER